MLRVRCLASQSAAGERALRRSHTGHGPLTDLACVVRTDAVAAANVDRVVAQIGARPGEPYDLNGRPALFSLNVSADPLATETVLASPALARATITASPYHLAGEQLLDDARLDRLGGQRPEGVWLREQAQAFRAFGKAAFADAGLRPWDQTLVHSVARPQAYRRRAVAWQMVDCADPTGRNASPACAGHGPTQFATRDVEGQQLWLGTGERQRFRARLEILDAYASPREAARVLDTVAAIEP